MSVRRRAPGIKGVHEITGFATNARAITAAVLS